VKFTVDNAPSSSQIGGLHPILCRLENAAIPPTYDYRKVLTAGQTNAMATLGFAEHFRCKRRSKRYG